jgi:hypothetical protein
LSDSFFFGAYGFLDYCIRIFISICVGLLALILVLQMNILGRLDEIAKRPVQGAVYYPSASSPNASEIAIQVRRQMALDGPPSFSFEPRSWSGGPNGEPLKRAVFSMIREAGPASDVSIKTMPDITTQIQADTDDPTRGHSTDNDYYNVTFGDGHALPSSWTFSLFYVGHDGIAGEKNF